MPKLAARWAWLLSSAIALPAIAQPGQITLELVPSSTEVLPGEVVSFSILASFSGFDGELDRFWTLVQAVGYAGSTADSSILFDSAAPGDGLPFGDETDEFAFEAGPVGGELWLQLITNGYLVIFRLHTNPQDVELFTFDVVAGAQDFNVYFEAEELGGITIFNIADNDLVTVPVAVSPVAITVVPAPAGAALMLATLPLAARRRRA